MARTIVTVILFSAARGERDNEFGSSQLLTVRSVAGVPIVVDHLRQPSISTSPPAFVHTIARMSVSPNAINPRFSCTQQ
jgi:hypothetical protein